MLTRARALRGTHVVAVWAAVVLMAAPAVPAWADVTVTPTQVAQGSSAGVTFRLTNDSRSASMTRVTVFLPEATPIGEVYPYSVPGWAPRVSTRRLDPRSKAAAGIRTNDVTTAVEWNAARGKAPGPGKVVELAMSLNPIPAVDRLTFTVAVEYSDGTAAPWGDAKAAEGTGTRNPGPTIAVVPRAVRRAGAEDPALADRRTATGVPAGTSSGTAAGGLLVALLAAAAVVLYRRRAASTPAAASAEGTADKYPSPGGQADGQQAQATASS
jgi:uncharacterized protein YcnI